MSEARLLHLLDKAGSQGISLWAEDGKLRYRAPEGSLSAELKLELTEHKADLVAYLSKQNGGNGRERPPLSFGQERMWYLHRLDPERTDYTVVSAFHLGGAINTEYLDRTLVALVDRHEQLRCSFPESNQQPWQHIEEVPGSLLITEEPLEAGSREGVLQLAKERVRREQGHVFSLQEGPLFKTYFMPLHYPGQATDEAMLLFSMHHSIMDGSSADLFYREFGEIYSAFVEHRESRLPKLSSRYTDYATLQKYRAETPVFMMGRQFWSEYLEGAPLRLDLPAESENPKNKRLQAGTHAFSLDRATTKSIRALCAKYAMTPFQLFLTLFGLMLQRLSGRQDLLVGVPVSGRDTAEHEHLFGLFLSTVPVRLRYSGEATFSELLEQNRRSILDAFDHKEIPFEQIVEDINPPRDPDTNPLFQVFFNQLPHTSDTFQLPGVDVKPLEVAMQNTRFDLTAYLMDRNDRFHFEFEYAQKQFSAEKIRVCEYLLLDLVEACLEHPGQPVGHIRPSKKRFTSLPDPSAKLNDRCGDHPIHHYLEQRVREQPESTLLVHGTQPYSAEFVNQQINRLAHALLETGRPRPDVIPVVATRNPGLYVAVHAILKSGAAFMLLDPAYPAAHHLRMLAQVGPSEIWSVPGENGKYPGLTDYLASHYEIKRLPRIDQIEQEFADYPVDNPELHMDADRLAYLAQTSGTTGTPRLIRGLHRPVSHFLEWYPGHLELGHADRFALTSGLSHDPLLRDLFVPAAVGGALYFPPDGLYEEARTLPRWLRDHRITVWHTVPSVARLLVDEKQDRWPELRHIVLGGEQLSGSLVRSLKKKAPKAVIWNAYGTTETPQIQAMHRVDTTDTRRLPVGSGVPESRLLVLNNNGRLAYPFEPGVCHIQSPCLAAGYLDAPDDSAFIRPSGDHPFSGLMFRTGDLAHYNHRGEVVIDGRTDRQVNISGHRIQPGEIEHRLEALNAIEKAHVFVDTVIRAVVVPAESGEAGLRAMDDTLADRIRTQLRAELPEFQLPSQFFVTDRLPVTPTGKVDTTTLLQWINNSAPDQPNSTGSGLQNKWERLIASIWETFLDTKIQHGEARFFELGGHSLLGLRVFREIEEQTGIALPLKLLFEQPTVRGIAEALAKAQPTTRSTLRRYTGERFPLSEAQQRIWLLSEVQDFAASYTMPSVVHLRGKLDIGAFGQALTQLIREEPALRTRFGIEEGTPWQQIISGVEFNLQLTDGEDQPERRIAELANRTIRLSDEWPYRFDLLHIGPEQHVLVAVFHHIITDAWSIDLLVQKLSDYYHQCKNNTTLKLSEPGERDDRYYTHLSRQHTYPDTPAGKRDLAYWKAKLDGAPTLELMPDYRRPSEPTRRGGRLHLVLDPQATVKLENWTGRHQTSIYTGMLTLVSLLMQKYSGQHDFVIGSVVSGRTDASISDLAGCFVNMVPLRIETEGDRRLSDHLKVMHHVLTGALEHQQYPFDRLVRELKRNRDLSRHPLFNVAVVYQNALDSRLKLEGLELEGQPIDTGTTKFDLTFTFEKQGEQLHGYIEYSSDIYDKRRIEHMRRHLLGLVSQLETLKTEKLRTVAIISPEEREQLQSWNESSTRYPDQHTLTSLFLEACRAWPDRTALVRNEVEISYGRLREQARRVALHLKAEHQISRGRRVLVQMERSELVIPILLGINWAGGIYVPVDPGSPESRRRHITEDSNPALIIDDDTAADLLKPIEGEPELTAAAGDPCYIIYTSGSTGMPKGCEVLHRNVVHLLFNDNFPFDFSEQDCWISCHSFNFDFSVWEMYGALLRGGKLVIADEEEYRDPQQMIELIREHEVTVLNQTPAAFYSLMEAERQQADHHLDRHLRYVMFGGDRLDPEYLKPWTGLYDLSSIQLVNMYGITETTVHVTYGPLDQADIDSSIPGSPIGRPLPGVEVWVFDEDGNAAPAGIPGEFYVGGPGVSNGYLNRPELNAEKFIRHPHHDGSVFYRTGDVGRWRFDGTLEYVDRNDRQVQIRGHRIEPGEIESVLAGHPDIEKIFVVPYEDSAGLKNLAAYIVPAHNQPVDIHRLKTEARTMLPAYMVPSLIITIDEIPLSPNGKVDRSALPDPGMQQAPIRTGNGSAETELQSAIRKIWAEHLERDDFGIEDNFFDLGGHSLMLMKVCNRLNTTLDTKVRVVDLFAWPTIRDLADFIGRSASGDSNAGEQEMQERLEKRKMKYKNSSPS